MDNRLRYALKRMALDISDGLSNTIENITKGRRYKGLVNDTTEIGENLTDRILNSRVVQAISEKLTDLYAFIENRRQEIEDEDWSDDEDRSL